ncbi:DUF4132 domain-containing protein [Paraflavitalea sp. CAU 1676]|uniref:DUF4132 domain-containing protein n=1 Tax=Paraflavitalea sp. CAU 1676 TaxID=3032598 RepID=UPI0023DC47BB|nr:DUF4132 domain-containing protein [Paraflavitalea sp. CAU 1676]MDF2191195.1 DUF4132 domain-containing protein [Paraflavitalea sp. CAU 1676]
MAFTLEAIDQIFQKNGYYGIEKDMPLLKQSANFQTIANYLTGKTTTLGFIEQDYGLYKYQPLVAYLQNFEQPSEEEQLIINLCLHPDLVQSLSYTFAHKLVQYTVAHPTNNAVAVTINYFQKIGYGQVKVFEDIVSFFDGKGEGYVLKMLQGTELKQYLSEFLMKSGAYRQPTFLYSYSWNFLYFLLLEENMLDEHATNYAIHKALHDHQVAGFLLGYREGKYVPAIIGHLQQPGVRDRSDIQQRFTLGLGLYNKNKEQYGALLTGLANLYLFFMVNQKQLDNWESTWLQEDDVRYKLSGLAVYYLLQFEREQILKLIHEWMANKKFLSYDAMEALHKVLGKEALPLLQSDLQNDSPPDGIEHYTKMLTLMQEHFEPADYLPFVWKVVGTKSKPLKAAVIALLVEKDASAEEKAIALLDSKQAETRLTAAVILQRFASTAAIEAVNKALQKESNDNARDVLLQTVAADLEARADKAFVQEMIEGAKKRGKLNAPMELWLEEAKLPDLYYKDGSALNVEAVRFLIYRMSRVKTMRSDVEARILLSQVDRGRAGEFARQLFQRYLDNGAKAEHKFLMAVAALLGDDDTVDKIRTTINNWLEENRTKMAEHGVGALALQGNDKALRWVEWYSRKYRNKKAVIGATALQALEDAAEELGITIQELGDRIVPDFGFEGLFRHFRIGDDEYRAFIDSKFKISFFDEDNKALKNLPAAASADLKAEFKDLAKEVRDVVKSQSLRLENYLVVQRVWPFEVWQAFFLHNPVMFIYATKLLWGVYNEGRLVDCFICQEDTTLVNIDDDEITIPEGAQIRIVHPIHLTEGVLQVWKRKFFDLSIEPIFPQLDRPIYRLADEESSKAIMYDFNGKETVSGSIRGTLERFGWRKGQAEDAGSINAFHFLDYSGTVEAVLEVQGVFAAGFDSDIDPALGRLYFMVADKGRKGWFTEPRNEKDERLIPVGRIADTLYSEVLASVHAIKLAEAKA